MFFFVTQREFLLLLIRIYILKSVFCKYTVDVKKSERINLDTFLSGDIIIFYSLSLLQISTHPITRQLTNLNIHITTPDWLMNWPGFVVYSNMIRLCPKF